MGLPAGLLVTLLVTSLLAAVWSCARPRAAALLAAVALTGVAALAVGSAAALAVWLAAAPASLSLYFVVLPRGAAGGPAWCEVRDKILFVFCLFLLLFLVIL